MFPRCLSELCEGISVFGALNTQKKSSNAQDVDVQAIVHKNVRNSIGLQRIRRSARS
jgi:hypothetical protein